MSVGHIFRQALVILMYQYDITGGISYKITDIDVGEISSGLDLAYDWLYYRFSMCVKGSHL